MKRSVLTAVVIVLCLQLGNVYACSYNGSNYPPGSKVGGRTCQSDGSWR